MRKIKASMSVVVEINNEFIVDYAEINNDKTSAVDFSNEEIDAYFNEHKEGILEYAKESAIDILAEQCDEIALRGQYGYITTEEIQ